MKLRPYIFLDFDGVISTYIKGRYGRDERVFTGAKLRGRMMQEFLEDIKARLIISSNWRYGRTGKGATLRELALNMEGYLGITYPIHDTTPLLAFMDDDYFERDQVILDFVSQRRIKAPWIAFDDMKLEKVPDRHKVVTDPYTGVVQSDFITAYNHLIDQS